MKTTTNIEKISKIGLSILILLTTATYPITAIAEVSNQKLLLEMPESVTEGENFLVTIYGIDGPLEDVAVGFRRGDLYSIEGYTNLDGTIILKAPLVDEDTICEIGARKEGYEFTTDTIMVLNEISGYIQLIFGRIDNLEYNEDEVCFTVINVFGILIQWENEERSSMIFHLKNQRITLYNYHNFRGVLSDRAIFGMISSVNSENT